jgi:Cdc6-like AAA superfamily ATPase
VVLFYFVNSQNFIKKNATKIIAQLISDEQVEERKAQKLLHETGESNKRGNKQKIRNQLLPTKHSLY